MVAEAAAVVVAGREACNRYAAVKYICVCVCIYLCVCVCVYTCVCVCVFGSMSCARACV